MATHTSLRGLFTAIANAIRAKTGESADIVADNFPTAIAAIPTGATLGEKSISQNGTYNAPDDNLSGYSKVSVNVASAGDYTADDWLDTSKPIGAIISAETNLKPYQLSYRTGITDVILLSATSIPDYFCYRCTDLKRFRAPNATSVGIWAIGNCSSNNWEEFFAPNADCGSDCFRDSWVKTVVCKTISIRNNFGKGMTKKLDLTGDGTIGQYNFVASTMDFIVLRSSSIVQITANTAFPSSGFSATIYIPASLYSHIGDGTSDDYTAATNWSTVVAQNTITWKSIESTHTDPNAPIDLTLYYADGTAIPTT